MSAARPIHAQLETTCAKCHGPIRVGDPIERSMSVRIAWQHDTCPPGKLDLVRPVCTECFTEQSVDGSCLCGAI